MRPYNLAEARIAERNYCQAHINKRLKVIVALIAFTVFVATVSFVCRMMFTGEATTTRTKLADAQGQTSQIRHEMSVLNVSLSQCKWQKQLAGESKRWLGVMNYALGTVPSSVWLDRMETSGKDCKISITGRAATFDALSTYILGLRATSTFSDVRLGSAKVENKNGSVCVGFSIDITLKNGGNSSSGGNQPAAEPNKVPEVPRST